jgi:hypothetical protein
VVLAGLDVYCFDSDDLTFSGLKTRANSCTQTQQIWGLGSNRARGVPLRQFGGAACSLDVRLAVPITSHTPSEGYGGVRRI